MLYIMDYSPPKYNPIKYVVLIVAMLLIYITNMFCKSETRPYEKDVISEWTKAFTEAIMRYKDDCGIMPSPTDNLGQLLTKDAGMPGWNGPYLTRVQSLDPWGNPTRFRIQNGEADIVSDGPDAEPNTDDDIIIRFLGITGDGYVLNDTFGFRKGLSEKRGSRQATWEEGRE